MSFLAKLNIDGEEFNILDCRYSVRQRSDDSGMPSTRPKGGKIQLLIESTVKVDFFEWALSSSSLKSGEITFFKRDNISSLKTIQFVDAFCLEFSESFNSEDSQPLQSFIEISAKEITVKGVTLSNNWPNRTS